VTRVFNHPDGRRVLVVAGGQGYVLDVQTARVDEYIGMDFCEALEISEPASLVFAGFTHLDVVTADGVWRSARVSWDGIQDLELRGTCVVGNGWDAINDCEGRFAVDLETRQSTSDAYPRELG
jgi:hypothetical protein